MTYLNSDRLPDNSVGGGKLINNSITEDKLGDDVSNKIDNSNNISNLLLQAYRESDGNPQHFIDPFVRANLIPIPFEDAEVKRILVENYSTTGDGELWYKDAKNVEELGYNPTTNTQFNFRGNKDIRYFREYRFFPKASFQSQLFANCVNLEYIDIPEEIKYLSSSYVFKNCSSLKLNHIPDSVESIFDEIFNGCKEITLTKLPDNIKNLRPYALGSCTKCDITVAPVGITELQEGNWGEHTSLISRHLTVLSPTITHIGWRSLIDYDWVAFEACTTPPPVDASNIDANAIIYVPDEAVDTYKEATGWKDLADRIKPLSEKPATT